MTHHHQSNSRSLHHKISPSSTTSYLSIGRRTVLVLATLLTIMAQPDTMSKAQYLPPSLQSQPVCSLVPPGKCQLTDQFQDVELIERVKVSPTSSVLRFALPDSTQPLNLCTCACILAYTKINGEDVIRPYTPISTNALKGCFDLLVKDYGPDSKMSHEMCSRMNVGDKLAFKHIEFNVKIQAPFQPKHICMLVGGTGISPMIQALHAILGDESQKDKRVVMLYGSRTSDDILGREMLDRWTQDYPDQLVVQHILSEEPADSDWTGLRGYIDASKIQEYFPAADLGDDVMIFVCGPPPMYAALCGPREEKDEIKGVLGELHYQPNQVYKF